MGIADSPLRDRVVFVVGSPRSGTTWLAHLLLSHPGIGGIANESHLFDEGVNTLFDNHERMGQTERFLVDYLDRAALVDLVRGLCDGVLLSAHAQTKPRAPLVLEKTPVARPDSDLEIRRKSEVYPDARWVHVIRDGRAVARSLLRAPWHPADSAGAAARIWRHAVEAIRAGLDGANVIEVRYEQLRADPLLAARGIFGWLGLDAEAADPAFIERLSAIKHATSWERDREIHDDRWRSEFTESDLQAIAAEAGPLLSDLGYGGEGPAAQPPLLRKTISDETGRPPSPAERAALTPEQLGRTFAEALRFRDHGSIRELVAPDFRLELRSGAGDRSQAGPEAIEALIELADAVFGRKPAMENWLVTPGSERVSMFYTANAPDGSRIDIAILAGVGGGWITAAAIVVPGDPSGQPVRDWPGLSRG